MPLVSSKPLLDDAYKNHYAIGAFAVHNLEIMKAVISGAEKIDTPVIFQTTPGTIKYVGIENIKNMVNSVAEKTSIPIALHLDHGDSFKTVLQCLRAGYTSVMIDGSKLQYEENVALVQKVVEAAHYVNVPVEAELGTIGGVEDDLSVDEQDAQLTDPDLAKDFVARTDIDSFAPAFGTAHGLYKKEPRLNFELVQKISESTGRPIVMHGASGVPEEKVRESLQYGVSKVNFSTELKVEFVARLRDYLNDHPHTDDPRKYFVPAREAVEEIVKKKILMLQSQQTYA
ncbi:class II fructose-1,6-bisphosphate aldolase [Alkalihalobacillus hwajinpoensis]|uniref:class II fructose-1,6-bisphosphate aldolase n=1 Tax=Guptibacillus hwajinpoensis TaxID=208199 RepID=UPI0018846D51|nr:class II fructose-1,6-bisphosphate aldolase [Pseudalkalibacillus hwajinpoensis]MBF0708783.1 class II fructose-1,6-bisphosphate aldolase [Pseudalkalibacillus hwajinpoensis]